MPTIKRCLLVFSFVFWGDACRNQNKTITTETQAARIAEEYVYEKYGNIDRSVLETRITDHGRYWFVAYDPPEGYAGGGPKIVIEKSTGKVAAAFMDQ